MTRLLITCLLLLTACTGMGLRVHTATSCPSVVGEDLGAPEKQVTLTADDLTVQVRYFGVRPGAGGAKCHNAVAGVTANRAVTGSKPPEVIFTGRLGKTYRTFISSHAPAGGEALIYLTVPAQERLVRVRLKHGTKSQSAEL